MMQTTQQNGEKHSKTQTSDSKNKKTTEQTKHTKINTHITK